MGVFGGYSKQSFQNGVTTVNPTTFQPMEDKIEDIDNELAYSSNYRFEDLKKYFWMRNCKDIASFENYTDWTGVGCNVAAVSGAFNGNGDTYFVDSDASASTIYIHNTVSSINLEKFNDEEASTTSDVISLSLFLFDYTKLTNITLKLGDDNANNYNYTWSVTEGKQVTFQAKKTDFTTTGTPTGWDDITYIHIQSVTLDNADTSYITCMSLMMYRNDPDSDGNGQPFQIYSGSAWSSFFTQTNNAWNLILDPKINNLGIQCLNDYNDSGIWNGLKVKSDVISFVWKSIFYNYYAGYTNNMTWYFNSSNFATVWIDNNDFTLRVVEGGATTNYTFTLNNSLTRGERLEITLEKNVDTIRATLEKGNDRISALEHETSIDSETSGDLYFGFDTIGLCFIPDFIISNINNLNLDSWDKPKIVVKQSSESTNTDTTMSNDSELFAYLPPNSMFEVALNLAVSCTSNTPDIKIDWDSSGVTLIGDIFSVGPAASITSIQAAEATKHLAINSLTYDNVFGLDGDGTATIKENFIISTGSSGGYLKLRWAQNVSDATAITVGAMSYLKITKVDLLQQNN
jgi:hypothetical protein